MIELFALIDRLESGERLSEEDFCCLIERNSPELAKYAAEKARKTSVARFGKGVFIRGLVEISSYCRCDCLYCGIRRSNTRAERYRLAEDEILACCGQGYGLGFRTFVLQGGEDPKQDAAFVAKVVKSIKGNWPDCAVTLSLGEKSQSEYALLKEAGADRYLLRHETADHEHFSQLHPTGQTLEKRLSCLADLKLLGFQTGAGFMVGSPGQTARTLARDLCFLQQFRPEMVGIGPFLPHSQTPFAEKSAGSVELTLFLLSLVRLMMPQALLPATTALGTVDHMGREKGILVGANVVMPNLSPASARKKYMLYDNKRSFGSEAAEGLALLEHQLNSIGYHIDYSRGDFDER